jgi:hypothetical protein
MSARYMMACTGARALGISIGFNPCGMPQCCSAILLYGIRAVKLSWWCISCASFASPCGLVLVYNLI